MEVEVVDGVVPVALVVLVVVNAAALVVVKVVVGVAVVGVEESSVVGSVAMAVTSSNPTGPSPTFSSFSSIGSSAAHSDVTFTDNLIGVQMVGQ